MYFIGVDLGTSAVKLLLMDEEGLLDTPNKQIHIGRPIDFDEELFKKQLDELYEEANGDEIDIKAAVQKIVPTYIRKEG